MSIMRIGGVERAKREKPPSIIQSIRLSGLFSNIFILVFSIFRSGIGADLGALWNYEVKGISFNREINVLSTLDLAVETNRNRLVKLHLEVGNSFVGDISHSLCVFQKRSLLIATNKLYK